MNVYVGMIGQWRMPVLKHPPQLLGNMQRWSTLYVAMTKNLVIPHSFVAMPHAKFIL